MYATEKWNQFWNKVLPRSSIGYRIYAISTFMQLLTSIVIAVLLFQIYHFVDLYASSKPHNWVTTIYFDACSLGLLLLLTITRLSFLRARKRFIMIVFLIFDVIGVILSGFFLMFTLSFLVIESWNDCVLDLREELCNQYHAVGITIALLKSFLAVGQILQIVFGGIIIEHGFSAVPLYHAFQTIPRDRANNDNATNNNQINNNNNITNDNINNNNQTSNNQTSNNNLQNNDNNDNSDYSLGISSSSLIGPIRNARSPLRQGPKLDYIDDADEFMDVTNTAKKTR